MPAGRTIRAVRRLLLVVNEMAQAVTGYTREVIAGALSAEFSVDLVETKARGHAIDLARDAAGRGLDLVVALGGDGTVNEVANGLAGTDTPMAVLPGGGANVFARSLGLPRDAVDATGALLERLHEEPRRVPLGRISGRWFTTNCGIGVDAAIVRRVEGRQFAKRMAGELFFVWSTLRVLFSDFDRRVPHLRVTFDDGEPREAFTLFLQNVDPFTYFGDQPLRLCPEASLEDGLDAVALQTMRLLPVGRVLLRGFRSGRPLDRGALYGHDLGRIVVESDVPMPLQTDGEFVGEWERVEIESIPGALSLYG
jgi:diacylglycerol kinase family enzyme